MKFQILHSFISELPADSSVDNVSRQVENACFSFVQPKYFSNPSWIHRSEKLPEELQWNQEDVLSEEFLHLFSGQKLRADMKPFAMNYGGHQFGHWAGQLGDGRAINLFESIVDGRHYTYQLKGAGKTPYSRGADGLAVMRSCIREHLCSEAMHYLSVPTTRSLGVIFTGEEVLRDILYDGHPRMEKGAISIRVAPSFIRFGNFEILASRGDILNLTRLADYTIRHFFPNIMVYNREGYLQLFHEIATRTMQLILEWQRVGFVHGVMNTDNMSILGWTIDYGPYGWLEGFDPNWTPNTTDREYRRYRFGNQPNIALWNLTQLANALYPLIEDIPAMEQILNDCHSEWKGMYHQMISEKLGISAHTDNFAKLIEDLEINLTLTETDYTIFFRQLAQINFHTTPLEALEIISFAFYHINEVKGEVERKWISWLERYKATILDENREDRAAKMNAMNPKYVLRNYMAQMAIDEAEKGRYELIDTFYHLLTRPYDEQPEHERWYAKRPEWARDKIGCSMLSCSS